MDPLSRVRFAVGSIPQMVVLQTGKARSTWMTLAGVWLAAVSGRERRAVDPCIEHSETAHNAQHSNGTWQSPSS